MKDINPDDADVVNSFKVRLAQLVLGGNQLGVDPTSAARIEATLPGVRLARNPFPEWVSAVMREPSHPRRINTSAGPFLFISGDDETQPMVVDVPPLLVDEELTLRSAAYDYITASTSQTPWLTSYTLHLLHETKKDITSSGDRVYLESGLRVVDAIGHDHVASLAGLKQSVEAQYQEGMKLNATKVLFPSFESLSHFRPSIWNPTEQSDSVAERISQCASAESLDAGLSLYVEQCGYLPLKGKLGAVELVRQWLHVKARDTVCWKELWQWACASSDPTASYHALMVLLESPSLVTGVDDSEVSQAVRTVCNKDITSPLGATSLMASYVAEHIDALHPAQNGNVVASYAWYLARQVVKACIEMGTDIGEICNRMIVPAANRASLVYSIARSRSVPSCLRYATSVTDIWELALLKQIHSEVSIAQITDDEVLRELGIVLRSSLVNHSLVDRGEDSSTLANCVGLTEAGIRGWTRLIPQEEQHTFLGVIEMRNVLNGRVSILDDLAQLSQCDEIAQFLVCTWLRDTLSLSDRYDGDVVQFMAMRPQASDLCEKLSERALSRLLDGVLEVHCRCDNVARVNIPHALCELLEGTRDEDRANLLIGVIAHMAITSGVNSSIRRMALSRWKMKSHAALGSWHETLAANLGKCEPWVRARIRAVSATITDIRGPRIVDRDKQPEVKAAVS